MIDRVDRRLRKLPAGVRVQDRTRAARAVARPQPTDRRAAVGAGGARQRSPPQAAGRAGLRGADRRDPDRPHRRQRAVPPEASFALQTGTAPIPCSSGKRTQHRLNRGGDRQLNHALHIIAVTRAQHDATTKEYLARKEAEGKTTKGALRSLKRHLARHFHRLLAEPPADQQPAGDSRPMIEPPPAIEPSCPRSRRVLTPSER